MIATGAIASLLLPTLALANERGVRADGALKLRIEHRLEKAEKRDMRGEKHEDHLGKRATTSAAAITKQGVRIQNASDNLLSFNVRMSALIAGAGVEEKAALEAKFAEYTTAATHAKLEAGKAIAGAAQVNANNSTTTNATLIAAAKTDIREAKAYLHTAKETFFSILRTLWK